MNLRRAALDDFELLRHWDQQPHVKAAGPNDDWQWETELARDPAWRRQLIAEVDGKPIGFIQIVDPHLEETHYWGDIDANLRAIDIWIGEKENLNKGYGSQMMKLALEICFSDSKVTAVLVDPLQSNRDVHRFYECLGFIRIDERRFGCDDCYVYRLMREDW